MTDGQDGSGQARWDAVLFDLDGTLADTIELILASYRHTMHTHLGHVPPDERWLGSIGRPLHDQIRDFSRNEAEATSMVDTYVAFQRTVHDSMTRPYPGVAPVLDELRDGGTALGVVTSKRSRIARRTLECCELSDYFSVVVCADHVERGKPDPEPVHRALGLLGAGRADRVLFVGDSPYDVQAGNRGGVQTAAALWGPYTESVLSRSTPNYFVREISDVLRLSVPT